MGQTIAERILARAAGRSCVSPDEYIWVTVHQTNAGPQAFEALGQLGITRLARPDTVWCVSDHYAPPPDQHHANHDNALRAGVRKYGVGHFFEYGRHGISHQLFGEQGAMLPGTVSAMSDSHSTSGGVFNCFATPVGGEVAFVLATGRLWVRVPHTIRIDLEGELSELCFGKDIALTLMGKLSDGSAIYKALEIGGPGLRALSIDGRWTICNMGIETGAKATICEYDGKLSGYLTERTAEPYEPAAPDHDCAYSSRLAIDVSAIQPMVACPHAPSNVCTASEIEKRGVKVNQVFLGSCTNGRSEDIRAAAEILRGRRIHPDVRMVVSPASQAVWFQALREGWLETLAEAGALVTHSTCGPCSGCHLGVLGDGDVCVSTSNRNYRGRVGSSEAEVYLSSAATAAAAALTGTIVDPRSIGS
ncbi:MAG: aconitase/3-isopropylmalate dehydratase large subunit family protein [Bacillota bacterium]|nr:aconitase/3-isopropylmalate dehydratase large subunit family protein [Bacillota bacterium]